MNAYYPSTQQKITSIGIRKYLAALLKLIRIHRRLLRYATILALFATLVQRASSQTMLGGTAATSVYTVTGKSNTTLTDTTTFLAAPTSPAYNLVGSSSNALLQYQNGNLGSDSTTYGVIFRVRLSSYSPLSFNAAPLTLQIGIGPTSAADKATFSLGITLSNTANTTTGVTGQIFVADSGSASNSKGAQPNTWKSGDSWSTYTYITDTNHASWDYSAATTGSTTEAWLTFGVSFDKVYNNGASSSTSGIANFKQNTSTNYNIAVATFGTDIATIGNAIDYTASKAGATSALFSDPIAITSAAVPEPHTYASISALILPLGLLYFRRKKRPC